MQDADGDAMKTAAASIEVPIPAPSGRRTTGAGLIGRKLALFCIRAYQATAPMRPAMCRYQPSCSEYAAQCIARHGIWKGVALGLRRILRCNPLSSGGYDPAP